MSKIENQKILLEKDYENYTCDENGLIFEK